MCYFENSPPGQCQPDSRTQITRYKQKTENCHSSDILLDAICRREVKLGTLKWFAVFILVVIRAIIINFFYFLFMGAKLNSCTIMQIRQFKRKRALVLILKVIERALWQKRFITHIVMYLAVEFFLQSVVSNLYLYFVSPNTPVYYTFQTQTIFCVIIRLSHRTKK